MFLSCFLYVTPLTLTTELRSAEVILKVIGDEDVMAVEMTPRAADVILADYTIMVRGSAGITSTD